MEGLRPLFLCLAAVAVASCGAAPPGPTGTAAISAPPSAPPTATSIRPGDSGSPGLAPDATAACVTRKLAEMTEEQRVGQLFLVGVGGDNLTAGEVAAIESYHLGSVWLFNWRTGGVEAVRPLTAEIQALATDTNTHGIGFLVGADQEGGQIQRLTGPGFSRIPSALEQGGLSTATLQADAFAWGRELKAAGVNLNFAPVMDVVPSGSDATNGPIGALQREYGHDPTTVGDHGASVIRGMEQAGIATTLKHFPGLGRVTGNTDTAVGVVDSTTTADDPYLDAFRAGIGADAPFVMVSLATYSAIDRDHQAVFSPTIMRTLLRDKLGFEGVVMSDDLGATASVSSLTPGARATAFIAAGGDLMVVAGVDAASQMAASVLDRSRSDPNLATRVNDAAGRVLRAKQAYGLLNCS